jgi:SNF2 family DNA or RNA helicase
MAKQPYESLKIAKCMERFKAIIQKLGMDEKKFQVDGVRWLVENELKLDPLHGVRGGLLGDEMGLGKTITMTGLSMSNHLKRTLIIVPPILIDQWKTQIIDIVSSDKVLVYRGHSKSLTKDDVKRFPIVISTYGEITLKKSGSLLYEIEWSRIVFDEAHHLRSSNTSRYKGARMLKTRIRWLVSGTPIQNNKNDFYALCGILGLPSEYYRQKDNLKELSKQFILRRTKEKVGIKMTDLHLCEETVEWTNEAEKQLAKTIHGGLGFSNVTGYVGGPSRFALMTRARQICVLPRLLSIPLHLDTNNEILQSTSKLDQVVNDILKKQGNGDGKLIFCQFREEIKEIEKRLKDKDMRVAIIDGTISASLRKHVLNSKYEALILQIQTCCEGLNLQGDYNEIYFVSPHWNPSIEEQAIARCYRIGQNKPVTVVRYEMAGFDDKNIVPELPTKTIEKYIHETQYKKKIVSTEMLMYT